MKEKYLIKNPFYVFSFYYHWTSGSDVLYTTETFYEHLCSYKLKERNKSELNIRGHNCIGT